MSAAPRFKLPARLPTQYRHVQLPLSSERESWINTERRTAEFSFSSDTPIERWFAIEILSHEPGAIQTERILAGGALLTDHNWESQIGRIEKVWIEDNSKAYALARFSKNPHAEEIWQDVVDGIRTGISVGYVLDEWRALSEEELKEFDTQSDLPVVLVSKWTPVELSVVAVPADFGVGFGREQDDRGKLYAVRQIEGSGLSVKTVKSVNDRGSMERVEITNNGGGASGSDARDTERKRCSDLLAIGERFNARQAAVKAVKDNQSVEQFSNWVLSEHFHGTPVPINRDLGLNNRELGQYSILKAIRELSDTTAGPKLTGLEAEASAAMAQVLGRQPKGFFLPPEIVRGRYSSQRALTTTTPAAGPGSNLVATELVPPIIEFLYNWLRVKQAGARMLTGLSGNVAIPKQTGGSLCFWLGEVEDVTDTDQTFGQVLLTPKRLASMTIFSRQLVTQSSLDLEQLVREDLAKSMATELDRVALLGSGVAPQPRGIVNTPGINRFTFGSAELYPTYIDAVVAIDDAKVMLDQGAWISSPRSWGAGIGSPKFPNTGMTVISDTIIEKNNTLLGYPFLKTQQIPNSGPNEGIVFFGNWSDLLIAQWDGADLIVDPYSLSPSARIRIVMNQFWDVSVRYPEAFAVSTDPGYQVLPLRRREGPNQHPPNQHPPNQGNDRPANSGSKVPNSGPKQNG